MENAGVSSSGEKAKAPMRSKPISSVKSMSRSKSSSVSPGKPTMKVVRRQKPMSRAVLSISRVWAIVPRRFIFLSRGSEACWSGRSR